MTHFLELNLEEFNINQDFIRLISTRPSICVCCLAKNVPFIKLLNCKHVAFFETFFQNKMEYLETLVCHQCHGFLKKFDLFRQQVEESLSILNDRPQQITTNKKFQNLEKIPIKLLSVANGPPIEMLTSLISTVGPPSPPQQPITTNYKHGLTNTAFIEAKHDYQQPIIVSVKTESTNQAEYETTTDVKIEPESYSDVEIDVPLSELKEVSSKNKKQKEKENEFKPVVPHERFKGKVKIITLTKEELASEREKERLKEKYMKLPFKCETCITAFDHETLFKDHMSKRHAMKTGGIICDVCKSVSGSDASYKEHIKRHCRRYECEVCGKRNNTLQAVLAHYTALHGSLGTTYGCDDCDFSTESYRQFRYHRLKHQQPLPCPQCGKKFIGSHSLKMHILVIHKESDRVYSCEVCGKVYNHKSALRAHRDSIHSRSGGAYCAPCDTHFRTHRGLSYHLKTNSRHIDESAKKFICNECGKRYLHKCTLLDHINWVHFKRCTHTCNKCSKTFLRKSHLNRHRRVVHEKEKVPRDKICHHCGRGFTTNSILDSHIRTHTGERPLQCARCPATFAHAAARYTHNKLVHQRKRSAAPPLL